MANHLTDAQKKTAFDALKGKLTTCPVCKQDQFLLEDVIAANPMWGNAIHTGAEAVPLLMVACKHCAHVMLFSTHGLGVSI